MKMLWQAIANSGFTEIRCAFKVGGIQGSCSQAVFSEHVADADFVAVKIAMIYWQMDKFISELKENENLRNPLHHQTTQHARLLEIQRHQDPTQSAYPFAQGDAAIIRH